MNGKIFKSSDNIYEDQAKILFDFYKQKAEKIVNEETAIEGQIAALNSQKKALENLLSSSWNRIKLWLQGNLKKTKIELGSYSARISEFNKLHSEIFRDYKVTKLGVAYVPVAEQFKYGGKSFIVDYTGNVPESVVKLQVSKQNELFMDTIADLEKLTKEAPIVETSTEPEEIDTEQYSTSMQNLNQHDYFGKLERSLRTISFCMNDMDTATVELPLVNNESGYLNFLKEYATTETPQTAPVYEVFGSEKNSRQIEEFQRLNEMKDSMSKSTEQFEDVLKGLMKNMATSVQAISAMKVASTDKLVFESNKVLFKILKSPYNHYSPVLEDQEIERIKNETFNYGDTVGDYVPFHLKESSKVRFNMLSNMWVAEDGSATGFPFGVHQIQEEIVAPIVQNLLQETRIERMKIYNHIKDQKIDYLNKWHQDTEDFYGRNRAESADLINLMRSGLRDYVAAYNTLAALKKTEESMSGSHGTLDNAVVKTVDNSPEVLTAFTQQSNDFQNVQNDFENFMERLKEDIEDKAQKFEYIEYYDASLRDKNPKEIAVASSEIHDLDSRRKPLIQINPLFAKESDLPPEPQMENVLFEHIALNLPIIAQNTLNDLKANDFPEKIEETISTDDLKDKFEDLNKNPEPENFQQGGGLTPENKEDEFTDNEDANHEQTQNTEGHQSQDEGELPSKSEGTEDSENDNNIDETDKH